MRRRQSMRQIECIQVCVHIQFKTEGLLKSEAVQQLSQHYSWKAYFPHETNRQLGTYNSLGRMSDHQLRLARIANFHVHMFTYRNLKIEKLYLMTCNVKYNKFPTWANSRAKTVNHFHPSLITDTTQRQHTVRNFNTEAQQCSTLQPEFSFAFVYWRRQTGRNEQLRSMKLLRCKSAQKPNETLLQNTVYLHGSHF